LWRSFFSSDIARAVDLKSDLEALERWALDVDEERSLRPAVREHPTIASREGTVLNPLATRLEALAASIEAAEEAFGMTPMSRAQMVDADPGGD
jgi:hypothetical protein